MRKVISLAAVFGMGLAGIQPASKAETWWLVVAADSRSSNSGPLFWQIPLGSQQECEVGGSKLVASAKDGSFDKANVDHLGFECIKGK